jgi:hypothetical protein
MARQKLPALLVPSEGFLHPRDNFKISMIILKILLISARYEPNLRPKLRIFKRFSFLHLSRKFKN